MTPIAILCASCGRLWAIANAVTVYERQAVESCPCPGCGAYTLCCGAEPGGPGAAMQPPGVRGPALPSRGL